jgi:hypothetical protein
MARLARNAHHVFRGSWKIARPVDLVNGVAIGACHARLEVDVRGQAVLLRAVDPPRLPAAYDWRPESAVEVLFVQPYEVASDVV